MYFINFIYIINEVKIDGNKHDILILYLNLFKYMKVKIN